MVFKDLKIKRLKLFKSRVTAFKNFLNLVKFLENFKLND